MTFKEALCRSIRIRNPNINNGNWLELIEPECLLRDTVTGAIMGLFDGDMEGWETAL
jgi:hypothetical protein